MSANCPEPSIWCRLVDGDLVERDAQAARSHASGCAACTAGLERAARLLGALATPTFEPDQRRVEALMARVGSQTPRPFPFRFAAFGAVAAALAVGVVLVVQRNEGEFTARGSAAGWKQKAHAELRPLQRAGQAWGADSRLRRATPLSVWYRNVESGQTLYVLAWLVDGQGEVHWVVPAWREGEPAPSALRLPRAEGAALMPESLIPDRAAVGPGQLVTVVSTRATQVLTIEEASRQRRGAAEELFPDALVWRQAVQIEP